MKNRKWFIILFSLLFIMLCVLIKTNLINNFDNIMYSFITKGMNDTLTTIYKCITFLGSTGFIILLCVFFLILFILLKKKNYGIVITVVLIISTIVNNVLKIIFARVRPDVLKIVFEDSYSFPSGHTMAAVSMYGILMYLVLKSNINKRIKIALSIVLSIIPVLVAVSRVYLGAHFISDVCGAFLVSIILLLIETYFIDKKNWI